MAIMVLESFGMATREEVVAFMTSEFPQNKCEVVAIGNRSATVKRPVGQDDLRPGGTVSGPVLTAVADAALYAAILGEIGIVPLAVTTSLTINFLRKPSAGQSIVGVQTPETRQITCCRRGIVVLRRRP